MSSYLKEIIEKSENCLPIKVNNLKKCNLKNKMGLITPQIVDDFLSKSYINSKLIEEGKENTEKTHSNTIEFTKSSSKKTPTNLNQTNKIKNDQNYQENSNQYKPNLNSTLSKTLIKEYANSKRYKEDKAMLFPSIQESKALKNTPTKEKKENISPNQKSSKMEEQESEIDEMEELLQYQEAHLPVPLSKKDNENYKILKMKQMKRASMPPNKSAKKFLEEFDPKYEKDFKIHNYFSTMKKRKPVHSTRRIYSSNFILHKKKGISENFMIFRDKDIGIYEYWQVHIHESHNDEDVETDDEQKNIASNFCISEVKEGFEYIIKNGKAAFINFNRYRYLMNKSKSEKILEEIEQNLRKFIFSKSKTN